MSRSWVDVDLDAIATNAVELRRLAAGAELCAVVKAEGYGHGAVPVATAALAAGATRLAVAQVAEGVRLREAGIEAPIWVLAEPRPDEYEAAAAAWLEPAVYSPAGIDPAAQTGASMTVHLKLDTGMRRVGARPDDVVDLALAIGKETNLTLGSVWTHLACADDASARGREITDRQLDRYDRALAALDRAGIDPGLRHAANSAGTIAHPRSRRDVVRCGIALYGLDPSPDLAGQAELRPALRWATAVSHVKRVAGGEGVSYGHRRALERETTIATIPVGYADGLRRGLWSKGGAALIGGRRRPIVGVVTMDQTLVDCGDDPVEVGDEAILIGTQGDASITADDLATALDTINYEITCGIGSRVERRYRGGADAC